MRETGLEFDQIIHPRSILPHDVERWKKNNQYLVVSTNDSKPCVLTVWVRSDDDFAVYRQIYPNSGWQRLPCNLLTALKHWQPDESRMPQARRSRLSLMRRDDCAIPCYRPPIPVAYLAFLTLPIRTKSSQENQGFLGIISWLGDLLVVPAIFWAKYFSFTKFSSKGAWLFICRH